MKEEKKTKKQLIDELVELRQRNANLEAKDTDNKQIEDWLRLLKEAVDSLPIGITISNAEGKIVYTNLAEAEIHGYTVEDLIGRDAKKLAPSKLWNPLTFEQLHEMGVWKRESLNIRKNGEVFPVQLISIAVKNTKGIPIGIITACEDITERKQAEEALQKSEKIYRLLAENTTDMITRHSTDSTYLYISPACRTMFGYEPEKLIGTKAFYLMHPEDVRRVTSITQEAVKTGGANVTQYRALKKDGQYVWVETAGKVIKNAVTGEVEDIICVTRDISDRKRAEEEIERSYDSQRALNTLLSLSLKDIPLEELLNNTLDLILSIPWLSVESKGGIFIVEDNPEVLIMKTQIRLSEPIQKLCAIVPFGRCICGRAALTQEMQFADHIDDRHETLHDGMLPHGHYCIPIIFEGNTFGVINLYLREGHHRNPKEDEFLISISNTLAGIFVRKKSEKEMKKLSMSVEQSTDCVVITNKIGNIEYVNNAVEEITGYKRKELIRKNPKIFQSGKHDNKFYREMWDTILSGHSFPAIFTNRKKNGELFYLNQTITSLRDEKGNITHFIATGKDITQQKFMEEKISYLAYYDALTGLPNRNLFVDRLKQGLTRTDFHKRFVAVLVIDIDRFKFINDTFGLDVGDNVLKEVAGRLSGSVREGDTVARLESDEFGIVLIDVAESEDIIPLVEKIMDNVSQPMKLDSEEIVLTLSIGVSIYPNDGKDAHELMKNADLAFSKATQKGRKNYQFFTSDMNVKASEFILMEKNLLPALKNKEFMLNYQPYWEINTKRIIGMEALLRWKNEELGMVSPGKFIPVLEEMGLILEVGKWILETACRQFKEWQGKGYLVVPVSVNVSPVQFRQKDLSEMIGKITKEFSLDPRLLTLEITESTFMQDIEFTNSVLKKLKERGISISIDDFGTGYSSLSYLKRFPVDNLKIDISFIRDIATDHDTASIVTAIIAMAHTLNLKTIAEGVETEEQLKILRLLRCDMGQGYYISKPLPAEEIEKFLIYQK